MFDVAYMKLNGIDEENHKIFTEIERNRAFIKKIKEAEQGVDSNLAQAAPEKRLKLDTAAAMRMVKPFIRPSKMEAEALETAPQPQVEGIYLDETRRSQKSEQRVHYAQERAP